MVKKILLVIVLLPFLILMLAPKKQLLYFMERKLADQGIVISDGVVTEHPFGLSIEHPAVYVKGVKVATAGTISLWSVLLYTQGTIDTLVFDPSLTSYLPEKIEKISLVHTVTAPLRVPITITDRAFGGTGHLDLAERKASVLFPELPETSPVKRYLKHTKGGWTYEQRF